MKRCRENRPAIRKLPDGTNHISTVGADGASKQLKVVVESSNYKML